MIETRVLQGDQMVMEIRVWERLYLPDSFQYLQRKGDLSLTLTFRVQLRAPNFVLVTACPHHPARCHVLPGGEVDAVFKEATIYTIVEMMLDEYQLLDEDHEQILDAIDAFMDEQMPQAVSLDRLLLAT